MSLMDDVKQRYDDIPIPEELSERVMEAIKISDRKRQEEGKRNKPQKKYLILKGGMLTAAAAVVIFTITVNTNTAFAEGVSGIPVIGTLARVLTLQSYTLENEDEVSISVEIPKLEIKSVVYEPEDGAKENMDISMEIPGVEIENTDLKELENSINSTIYNTCESYMNEAVERAKEYKEAFLETGGTEEEWKEHQIEIKVFYEMKSQTDDWLSFVVRGTESWSGAYSEALYCNIDIKNGKLVTLKDILGDSYVDMVNESVRSQIGAKEKETGITFFTPEEGGFTGITENPRFYMNEAGNPVIVFEKYEIAPGAAGELEFEVARSEGQ